MRLIVTFIATLMATSTSFAQMQHPTKAPRDNHRKTAQAGRPVKTKTNAKLAAPREAKKKKLVVKPNPSTLPVAPTPTAPETKEMSLVESHLQIRYFSEFIGPNLTFNKGDDYPDVTKNGNYSDLGTTDPIDLWNQFSFRWKVSDKLHAIVNPRFTLQLGSTKEIRYCNDNGCGSGARADDEGRWRWEDWLVGVQGVVWQNAEGFSYFVRPGYRIPISRATRNSNWDGVVEYFHSFDWAGKDYGFGVWNLNRWYIANENKNGERYRIYIAPYMTYKLTDTVKFELYYENEFQHNAREGKSQGAKGSNSLYMKRTLQTANVGVSFPINASLSLYPFLRFYQLGRYDPETIGLGMWIMGAIY